MKKKWTDFFSGFDIPSPYDSIPIFTHQDPWFICYEKSIFVNLKIITKKTYYNSYWLKKSVMLLYKCIVPIISSSNVD